MEALDKKIEEMLSEMENRVEAMHEHASTAANLKDDVASLREGVRTVATTASDTCQALSDALNGFLETHNAALLRDSSAFGEVAGKAGASLEAASNRASAAAEAFEKNANSLVEALETKTSELAERAAAQEANSRAQIESTAARASQAMKDATEAIHTQAEALISASQKNIETVEELKQVARELKEVQETGLKNLEAALGERIHTTLEEKTAEQRDMIARKLEQQLNNFEKKSGAELDKQLKKMAGETESSIQKSVNWATFAAIAASAGFLVSLWGHFVGQ